MKTEIEQAESTVDAVMKLNNLQSVSTAPFDPRVVEFAKFVGTRLGKDSQRDIKPFGFMMACTLALYDLEQGVDGWSGEPLDTSVGEQPDYVYTLMFLNIPDLAEAAFPKPFADGVKEEFDGYLDQSGEQGDEFVTRPVVTLEQAEEVIIESSKEKAEQLDWEHFGLVDIEQDLSNVYDTASALILRNAGMKFPLNVLRGDVYNEALMLKGIEPTRKKHIGGIFWLAMITDEISIEDATLMRDWLYMKAAEVFAVSNKLDKHEVVRHFMETDKLYVQAGQRVRNLLANRQV